MVNCSRYTKNKAWEKERLVCQVLIFCVILCIGLFLRISAIDYSREIILGSDSATYDFAARNLMKYGVLTYDRNGDMYNGLIPVKPTEILNPGFPVFLAVLYQINDSTQFIYTVQLLLSMVILIMIYKILHLIGVSFWVAATAMLCAAVYPGFIYNLDYILTETLFTALMLLFAYFFCNQ